VTGLDLVKRSLRLIGAIASNENPQASDTADARSALNGLLESWSIDGFLVYQRVRESFPLTSGKQDYTIGAGGDFDTSRPTRITEANYLVNGTETPIEIISTQKWAQISNKTQQSSSISYLYTQGTFPLETIQLYPVPDSTFEIVLYSLKPLMRITDLSLELELPPGYGRALEYNLALELAPEYGADPSALVAMNAQESKAQLQRQNNKPASLISDVSGLIGVKQVNIFTGK
jgi:hypothetical protein